MSREPVALTSGASPASSPYRLPPRSGMWQKAMRNPVTLVTDPPHLGISVLTMVLLFLRSEERRVGKECRL